MASHAPSRPSSTRPCARRTARGASPTSVHVSNRLPIPPPQPPNSGSPPNALPEVSATLALLLHPRQRAVRTTAPACNTQRARGRRRETSPPWEITRSQGGVGGGRWRGGAGEWLAHHRDHHTFDQSCRQTKAPCRPRVIICRCYYIHTRAFSQTGLLVLTVPRAQVSQYSTRHARQKSPTSAPLPPTPHRR